MIKSFKVWLEDTEDERRVREDLLSLLGYEDDVDKQEALYTTIKDEGLSRVNDAIQKLDIDNNKKQFLINWTRRHRQSLLRDLLTQIIQTDLPDEDIGQMPGSRPAKLPPPQPEQPLGQVQPQQVPPIVAGQPT